MPVRDWLLSLSSEDRKAIGDDIRTAEFGWPVGMPLCRSLKGRKGLWEIRTDLSGGRIARVIFCSYEGNGFAARLHQKDPEDAGSRTRYRGAENARSVMTAGAEKGKAGQLFEDFLKEQGTYEETTEVAIKRVLAFQLAEAMKEQKVTKVEMARRLRTSRSQLDRLLDPENDSVTLSALARAARAVGRDLLVELV